MKDPINAYFEKTYQELEKLAWEDKCFADYKQYNILLRATREGRKISIDPLWSVQSIAAERQITLIMAELATETDPNNKLPFIDPVYPDLSKKLVTLFGDHLVRYETEVCQDKEFNESTWHPVRLATRKQVKGRLPEVWKNLKIIKDRLQKSDREEKYPADSKEIKREEKNSPQRKPVKTAIPDPKAVLKSIATQKKLIKNLKEKTSLGLRWFIPRVLAKKFWAEYDNNIKKLEIAKKSLISMSAWDIIYKAVSKVEDYKKLNSIDQQAVCELLANRFQKVVYQGNGERNLVEFDTLVGFAERAVSYLKNPKTKTESSEKFKVAVRAERIWHNVLSAVSANNNLGATTGTRLINLLADSLADKSIAQHILDPDNNSKIIGALVSRIQKNLVLDRNSPEKGFVLRSASSESKSAEGASVESPLNKAALIQLVAQVSKPLPPQVTEPVKPSVAATSLIGQFGGFLFSAMSATLNSIASTVSGGTGAEQLKQSIADGPSIFNSGSSKAEAVAVSETECTWVYDL